MLKIFIFLELAILVVLAAEWTPMDPEEVAFDQAKCMEDHFKGDFNLADQWISWKLTEGDSKTSCYVKCLVEHLGLYDGQAFKPDNLKQQYEAYKQYNGVDQQKAEAVQQEIGKIATDNDCKSVSDAFIKVNNANEGVLEKIYLVKADVRDKVYSENTQIKPKGISIFRFCGKQFYQDGEDAYCNVRRHGFSEDPKFIQHSNCTTRGMRWMKKNGEMDEAAILRDLHYVNENDKDDKVKESLKNCKVDEASKARDYYKCIYDGLGEQLFMKVLDYVEVRSENYSYRLREKTSKYDPEAMRSKVQSLDTDAKCPPVAHGTKK